MKGGTPLRNFDYEKLADRTWDNEILSYVAQIHEYKGKQELYIRQKPIELERLIEIAKIQSTESSNYILQMHRDLLKYTSLSYGGNFKTVPNEVDMTSANGERFSVYSPV